MSYRCLCCDKRDAGHKYACPQCVNDLRRWLTELEDYVAVILAMQGTIGGQATGSIGVSYRSKPPVSLTPMAMMDRRSTTADYVERNSPAFDPVGAEDHDHVTSLPEAVHAIATWIREERGAQEPRSWTLVSELRYLRGEVDGCAIEQWVDDLHSEIKELHHKARMLAHDAPPGPLGTCLSIECEGTVFPASVKDSSGRHDGGRCSACSRTYNGPDLVRLGVSEEMAG